MPWRDEELEFGQWFLFCIEELFRWTVSKQKQGILNRHRTARLSCTKRKNISEHYNFLFLSHLCLCYFCLTMALLSVLVLGLRLWQVLCIFYFRQLLSLYSGLSVKSFGTFKQWADVHNKGISTITVTKNRESGQPLPRNFLKLIILFTFLFEYYLN